ncbi:MAG: hypothetical protein MJH10_21680 [Epibacterium sp.]|nr:hypothetical protein [Epibacterium sp.]NQX76061.1 hypothetical protein [Epibacterium sp.]
MSFMSRRSQNGTSSPEKSFRAGEGEAWQGGKVHENNCRVNRVHLQDVARERFADLLRVAFPAETDAAIARDASEFLQTSEKTVRNWLDMSHSAPFDVVFAIGCRVGVFRVMDVMTRGESRHTVLGSIVQGAVRVFAK